MAEQREWELKKKVKETILEPEEEGGRLKRNKDTKGKVIFGELTYI